MSLGRHKLLTDSDLDGWEKDFGPDGEYQYRMEAAAAYRIIDDSDILRLIAEIRHLRSDEWLRAAARDVGRAATYAEDWDEDEALAILRKHRDAE